MRLGRLQAVLQATVGNGLSFDPLSFGQDGRAVPAVDVGGGEIVDAFVVSAVVVVVDEGGNLRFEIAGQKVIFHHQRFFYIAPCRMADQRITLSMASNV